MTPRRRPPSALHRSRGVALITAVFVVVLASIAAVALLSATTIALRRTENLQDSEAAWWYAEGLENWIGTLLQRPPGAPDVDGLGDPWAQPVDYLPFDRGGVRGQLVDLQGRFNLNNLASADTPGINNSNNSTGNYYRQQFRLLLGNLPGVDLTGIPDLGAAIQQWISPLPPNGGGAAAAAATYYLSLDVPYRPSSRLMTSPSELLSIEGVTPQIYQALKPYIATLPESGSQINVNTAPLPVLLSLATDVDVGKLQDFVKTRVNNPAQKVADVFGTKYNLLPADVSSARISVGTSYFQLQAQIAVGSDRLMLYSDLHRQQGKPAVVYARSTGAD